MPEKDAQMIIRNIILQYSYWKSRHISNIWILSKWLRVCPYLLFDRCVDVGQTLLAHSQEGLHHSPQSHEVFLQAHVHTKTNRINTISQAEINTKQQ